MRSSLLHLWHAQPDEWSGGRRMNEEPPRSVYDYAAKVRLSACGAFVTGLEDECMGIFAPCEWQCFILVCRSEVRGAAIESLGVLIARGDLSSDVYTDAVHTLSNMFNDDVLELRLRAMHAIRPILRHTPDVTQSELASLLSLIYVVSELSTRIWAYSYNLHADQLHLVLDVLHDNHVETRMGARQLLQHIPLASTHSVCATLAALLNNVADYPTDLHAVFKCLQTVGQLHSAQVAPLVAQLLDIHPYLAGKQPRINDHYC